MQSQLKQMADKATDLVSLSKELTESGLRTVQAQWNQWNLFSSLSVSEEGESERDETHYFLIPLPNQDHAIYTKRVLPPNVGITNELPKLRVFHLPDASNKKELDSALTQQLTQQSLASTNLESDLANRLEEFADMVDKETAKVSGGILLIGGAVALVNPLVGVGIAAKALFPSLGAKATKAGSKLIGDKLRGMKRQSETNKAEKLASKETNRLKPELYTNPILRSLHAILTNPNETYDPSMDTENWVDAFPSANHFSLTAEAVRETYKNERSLSQLPAAHRQWIQSF